jgi:hypothetical protein
LSCDQTIAENGRKSQHNLSTGQKNVPKGQFLQGSRNWEKCLALAMEFYFISVLQICILVMQICILVMQICILAMQICILVMQI